MLIAERVETAEDHRRAAEAGITHFQGYFFGRPATQRARRIPESRLGYIRLLHALSNPDLTVPQLEELIKRDAALCLRVLKTVNSAAFGLRSEVRSIREALVLLGNTSYALYLTHNPLLLMSSRLLARFSVDWLTSLSISVALCMLAGIAYHVAFEKPALSIVKRLGFGRLGLRPNANPR